jgi:hypothetical protein
MLPDFDRAARIGEFWSYPQSRTFAELLIVARMTEPCGRCWLGCYVTNNGAFRSSSVVFQAASHLLQLLDPK